MSKLNIIWKNRKQILEGIKNTVMRDEFVEKIAAKRQKICDSCVRKDVEGASCIIPGSQPCCNLCGCTLKIKLRSLSTDCPDLKWGAVITEEEEDELNNM